MATPALKDRTDYQYLEPRPGSFYQEMFVRGLNLRASRLIAWMEAEELTAAQAAADRSLPVEAVLEAADYVKANADVIAHDADRERQLLRDRGLIEASDL